MSFNVNYFADGWSDLEKQFFLERHTLYKDEVGKNRLFPSRKDMFNHIAKEMASIESTKDGGQVSSHFYSLSRKSKKGSIIDLSGVTIISANDALFINESGEQSTEEPLFFEIASNTLDVDMIGMSNKTSAINASC